MRITGADYTDYLLVVMKPLKWRWSERGNLTKCAYWSTINGKNLLIIQFLLNRGHEEQYDTREVLTVL